MLSSVFGYEKGQIIECEDNDVFRLLRFVRIDPNSKSEVWKVRPLSKGAKYDKYRELRVLPEQNIPTWGPVLCPF